jgi:hypothetical protein
VNDAWQRSRKLPRPLRLLDDLLRAREAFAPGRHSVPHGQLVLVVLLCGGLHGAVMGSYAGVEGALYAALKIPLLLLLSPLICLPSFRVVHAVLGLSDDLPAARRAVLAGQATLALSLASLSPVLVFVMLSTDHYHLVKLVNGALFVLASLAAQLTLVRHYRPRLAAERRHLVALAVWPAVYLFVALQLGYALRPFIGNPNFPTELLRDNWMGNVYLDLYWAVRGVTG